MKKLDYNFNIYGFMDEVSLTGPGELCTVCGELPVRTRKDEEAFVDKKRCFSTQLHCRPKCMTGSKILRDGNFVRGILGW